MRINKIILILLFTLLFGCKKAKVELHTENSTPISYNINYTNGFILEQKDGYRLYLRYKKKSELFTKDTGESLFLYIFCDKTFSKIRAFIYRIQVRGFYGEASIKEFEIQNLESKNPIVDFVLEADLMKAFSSDYSIKVLIKSKKTSLDWVGSVRELYSKEDFLLENEQIELMKKLKFDW